MRDWLNRIHVGDCRQLMRQMISDGVKVNCIVTSPPYWGLRDYGTGRWDGGSEACDHSRALGGTESSTLHDWDNGLNAETIAAKVTAYGRVSYAARCGKCGARRIDRQFGLERTWIRHVARMRGVFRLAHRLLADDGVLWLNYGDSYAGAPGGWQGKSGQRASRTFSARIDTPKRGNGLKPKDLVGMPWRVALALQDDGWWLRSDIIWHKPNPMPESIVDRPTKAHEYVFLFAKSAQYYYDADAIREPSSPNSHDRAARARITGYAPPGQPPHNGIAGPRPGANPKSQKPVSGWAAGPGSHSAKDHARANQGLRDSTKFGRGAGWRNKQNESFSTAITDVVPERNVRTVWTIPTSPFPGAHFATFPPDLVRRCVLAGSRAGDTLFDPFMGSGTVAQVADELGRQWIGCELNHEYAAMYGRDRAAQLGIGFV